MGPCSPTGVWGEGWMRSFWWEKLRKGWENLLREPRLGRGTGRRLWKRGWGQGEGEEGRREKKGERWSKGELS